MTGGLLGATGVQVGMWNLGSLSEKGGDFCDKLRKGMIDVCCSHEVRWREQGAGILGMKGRGYKLWWTWKWDWVDGVWVMVNQEMCQKMVEAWMASDSGGSCVGLWGAHAEVDLWACPTKWKFRRKTFYDELKDEWDVHNADDSVKGLVTIMDT